MDYFLEAIKIGLSISQAYEYEKICKKRDEAIIMYNEAVKNKDKELEEKYGDIILKCQAETQKLIYRR